MANWKKVVLATGTNSQYIKGDGSFATDTDSLPLTGGTVSGNIKIDQGSASGNPRLTFAHDNIGTNHYIQMDRDADSMNIFVNGSNAIVIDSNQNATFSKNIKIENSSASAKIEFKRTSAFTSNYILQAYSGVFELYDLADSREIWRAKDDGTFAIAQNTTVAGTINTTLSSTGVIGDLKNSHASGYGLKIQATDGTSTRYITTFNDKDDNVKARIYGNGHIEGRSLYTSESIEIRKDTGELYFSNTANSKYFRIRRLSDTLVFDRHDSNTVTALTINSNGTTTFASDVTVQNSGDAVLSLTSTHANGNTFFDMTNTGTGDSYIRWASDSNSSLIFAKSSGTTSILKLDNSNNATFAGNVGIGDDTPSSKLTLTSALGDGIRLQRSGVESTHYMMFDPDSINAYPAGGAIYLNNDIGSDVYMVTGGGQVGIGTSSPTGLLNLYKSNASAVLTLQRREVDGALTTNDIIGQIDFVTNDDSYNSGANTTRASIKADIQSSTSATGLIFETGNSNSATAEAMYISPNSNIGIGTHNPDTKLQIRGDFDASSGFPNTNPNKGLNISKYTGASADYSLNDKFGITFTSASNADTDYAIAGVYGQVSGVSSYVGGHIVFASRLETESALSEKMVITSSGNVSIGMPVASMSKTLHVQSNTGSASTPNGLMLTNTVHGSDSQIYMYAENDSGTQSSGLIKYDPDAMYMWLIGSGNKGLYINHSGNTVFSENTHHLDSKKLFLGSSSDAELYSDGSNTYFKNNVSNQDIIFKGNDDGSTNVEMFRIDTSLSSVKIPSGNLYFNKSGHQYILKNTGSSLRLKHEGSSAGDDIIFELSDGSKQHIFDHDGSITFGGDVTIGSNELIFDSGEKVFSTSGYVVADGDAGFIARDSGVNKLIINGSTATFECHISLPDASGSGGLLKLGASADIQIYHDGGHSYFDHLNTGDLYIRNLRHGGDIIFHTEASDGTQSTSALVISSTGKVAIGTTNSPTDPLFITDGANAYTGQDHRMIQLKRNAANNASNAGADTSAFCSMLFANNSNGFTIGYGGTSDRFRFLDGGDVERLTIKNGGNVGIGTTNPSQKLHISSSSVGQAKFHSTASSGARIYISDSSAESAIMSQNATLIFEPVSGTANASISATKVFLGKNANGHTSTTELGGYGVLHTDGSRYGNYGWLTFNAPTNNYTSGARGWALTNGYLGTDFAILKASSASTEPYLTTGGGAGTGTIAPFRINNSGNVTFGGGVSMPTGNVSVGGKLNVASSVGIGTLGLEKTFTIAFTDGVANAKAQIQFTKFWGELEISVSGTFANQNMAGVITKKYGLGVQSYATYANESRYTESLGVTADNFAIGEVTWDTTNSRYYIPIVHRVSTGNTCTVRVRCLGGDASQTDYIEGLTVSSVYTTDTTAYDKPEVSFVSPLGIDTSTPTAKLHISAGSENATGGIRLTNDDTAQTATGGTAIFVEQNTKDIFIRNYEDAGLRIRTHDTDAMYIDDDQKVGIGTIQPTQLLHIASPTDAFIQLERVDTSVANNDAIGAIIFRGGESSIADIGRIRLHADADFTSSSSPTKMVFETTPSGTTVDAVALTLSSDQSATFAGDVNISKAGNATLNIKNSSDGLSDEGEIGTIEFEGNDGSANRAGVMAKIVSRYSDTGSGDSIDGSANEGGSLGFFTSIATSVGGSQTLAEKMRIENNGNVGIGTTSPQERLHIKQGNNDTSVVSPSGLVLEMADDTANDTIGITFENPNTIGNAGSGGAITAIMTENSNGATELAFSTRTGGGTSGERVRIDATGNVGIGTTDPSAPLEISKVGQTIGGDFKAVATFKGTGTLGGVRVGYNTRESYAGAIASVSNSLSFWTHDSGWYERLTILANGNAGLGTTSPSSPAGVGRFLHIANASHAGIVLDDTGSTAYDIYSADGHLYAYSEHASKNTLTLSKEGNLNVYGGTGLTQMTVNGAGGETAIRFKDSDGNVDGYVYANTYGVGFLDEGGHWTIKAQNNTGIYFYTNNGSSQHMQILNSGNVGIGTTNDTYKLEVAGTGRFSGHLTASGGFSGKMLEIFTHNFSDDMGTTRHFLPWQGTGEQTTMDDSRVAYATPFAMIFERLVIRPENIDGSTPGQQIEVKVSYQADGSSTETVMGTYTTTGSWADETCKVVNRSDFSASMSAPALSRVMISLEPAQDISGTTNWYCTSVWNVSKSL